MPLRGRVCLCALGAWFPVVTWLVPVEAQIRRLPANTLPADGIVAYDLAPHYTPAPPSAPLRTEGNLDSGLPLQGGFLSWQEPWTWQLLPDGVIYPAYLAFGRESRLASQWVFEEDQGWLWDVTLGGRAGILRYGTRHSAWPEGWQLDIEGAAFPRLAIERNGDLVAVDFRFGVPLTFRRGAWEGKFSYYHLSSHLGDEFQETFPQAMRINYVRDVLVLGVALRPYPDLRLYTEAGWALRTRGGSQPWEFLFGFEYSPVQPAGICGAPFFALNGRIREEIDFGGNLTMQTGWQWRGQSGHLFRLGLHYFNGKSDQYQFFDEHENQIGIGLWYDY